jgi:hypothetical protein
LDSATEEKGGRATTAVGGVTELHGGGVIGESLEWRFGGQGFTERGLEGGGDDSEAIFGVGEARGGRGRARDDEERVPMVGASVGERGEGEELW